MRISTAHAYDATVERLSQRQSELSDAQLRLTSGKRVDARERRSDQRGARRARAGKRLAGERRHALGRRQPRRDDADRRRARRCRRPAAGRARGDRRAAATQATTTASARSLADQIRGLRSQLLAIANRADGAGSYLFGGQGSSTPPFLDAAGGVQYVGSRGETGADRSGSLPMTMDGAAAWMSAPTGNGVFETRSVTSSGSAWIDAGRVTDPAAITGSSYRLQFDVAAGVTTYSVLKDGAPTALGRCRVQSPARRSRFDGMAVTVNGAPAAGDAFEIAPSRPDAQRVRRARQGGRRPRHADARRRREGAGDGREPAQHRRRAGAHEQRAGVRRRGAEPDRQRRRATRHGRPERQDRAFGGRGSGHARRRSPTSRTGRPATMRRSRPTRRCSGCRCSTTSIHDRRPARLIRVPRNAPVRTARWRRT